MELRDRKRGHAPAEVPVLFGLSDYNARYGFSMELSCQMSFGF